MKFKVCVNTGYVGCKNCEELEIDEEDIEDVPEDEINDYVWEQLGGKDVAFDLCEMWIERVD